MNSTCLHPNCQSTVKSPNNKGYCHKHRYLAHPESNRERARKWAQNNPEKNRQRVKEWQQENPDKSSTAWRHKNPEAAKTQIRTASSVRRARELKAFVEPIDFFSVWCRDSGLCFICGFPADKNNWWLEHVIPLSRGGLHSYDNVAVSHPYCNNSKNNKLMSELLEEEH